MLNQAFAAFVQEFISLNHMPVIRTEWIEPG